MKKIISLALSLCMVLSLSMPTAWAIEFDDMPGEDSWSYAALQAAVDNGLLQGYDGKLRPGSALTRAEMAAIVNRAFGATDEADIGAFSDVKETKWYFKDIAKAVRMGTLMGDDNGRMNPDDAITREQAFTVLARAFRLDDGSVDVLADFRDVEKISDYAVGPIAALVAAGYVNGNNGKLMPKDKITREEFAQVIYKMLKNYISEEGTYTEDYTGNVMVNVPGVILKDLTVDGDLIIGEGVGNGEVTLDGVEVKGRLLVRGGGEHSIVIKNQSSVGHVILNKTGDGAVRLYTEEGCRVEVVYIPDGQDDVILEGTFNQVSVNTDTPIVLKDATVTGLTVSGENAEVQTQGATEITTVVIEETAAGASLTVDENSTVTNLESAAESVTVGGEGTVVQAEISGDNSAVNTEGTKVTVGEDTNGVTVGGETVEPGASVNPDAPSEPEPEKPDVPTIPTVPTVPVVPPNPPEPEPEEPEEPEVGDEIEVYTLDELKDALSKSYKKIIVAGEIFAKAENLTVAEGKTLVVRNQLALLEDSVLTIEGTVEVPADGQLRGFFATVKVEKGAKVTNNGFVYMDVGALTVDGTVINENWFSTHSESSAEITVNGAFVNKGTVRLENATTLTVNGIFENELDSWISVQNSEVTVAKGGWLENFCGFSLRMSKLSVDGTFINGSAEENSKDGGAVVRMNVQNSEVSVAKDGWFENFCGFNLEMSKLTIDGTFINGSTENDNESGYCLLNAIESDITINGTFINEEDFSSLVTDVDEPEAEVKEGSTITVNGVFTSKGNVSLEEATLTVNGIFENTENAWMWIKHGMFTVAKDGWFENFCGFNLETSKVTIDGTFINGSTEEDNESGYFWLDMIVSDITINGVFTSKGDVSLEEATLTVNGTFESIENTWMTFRNTTLTVETDGLFNNYGRAYIDNTTIINNGVFNNGKLNGAWGGLSAYGLEIVNNGTFVNEGYLQVHFNEYATGENSLVNNGKFVNGSLHGSNAQLYVSQGEFRSCGYTVSNADIYLDDVDFSHEGDQMFECSAGLYIIGGSFDVSKAGKETFVNTGWMTIVDQYRDGDNDNICQIDLGKQEAFRNDTCFLYYQVEVYSEDGLRRAEAAQLAKKAAMSKDKESYFGFDAYDGIDILSDLTITEDMTFGAFGYYGMQGIWTWDSEAQKDVLVPVTLTIEPGVTVTLEGCTWGVHNGGIIDNNGCITSWDYYGGYIQIDDGGSYIGDGQVLVGMTIRYYENRLMDKQYPGYSCYTVAIDGDNVYTIKNDVDINAVYSLSNDAEIVIFGHNGDISGAAAKNASNEVNVYTYAGLKAGVKAEYEGRVFDYIYVDGDQRIEIREDFMIDNSVQIFSNTGLIIPYGVTLTVDSWLSNFGDISVGGTLVITENGWINNGRNLEVGALFGDEVGKIIVYGSLLNNNYMHLYATGQLLKGSEYAWFYTGKGVLVEDEGSVNQFP